MTQKQYLDCLKKLNLTVSGKATQKALGLSPRQLRRVASGDSGVPPTLAILLQLLMKQKKSPDK